MRTIPAAHTLLRTAVAVRSRRRRLPVSTLGLIGLMLVTSMLLITALAPLIAPMPPNEISLATRLQPPLSQRPDGTLHVLGSDQLGRDVLSRVLYGSRTSIVVGVTSIAFAALIGSAAGFLAGYTGGLLDSAVMRVVDLQLAFPFILLALAIVAILGPSLTNIILVFVVTSWPIYTRTIRASVLVVLRREYVEAARSLGASSARIVVWHVLPNVMGPLIVVASFEMARIIIAEAALGFLGLGVPPPTATWGNMLADGRSYIRDAWWLSTFPGLAIVLLAAGVNFVGDALRDALDPRMR